MKKEEKRLYDTSEFFETIVKILSEKNLLPKDLEAVSTYSLDPHEILDDEWDLIGISRFGANEGIYLDMYMESFPVGGPSRQYLLGSFKTLYSDRNALYRMSKLSADFVLEGLNFRLEHSEDFNWTGYELSFFSGEKLCRKITAYSQVAMEYSLKNGSSFDYVMITENRTGVTKRIDSDVYTKMSGHDLQQIADVRV